MESHPQILNSGLILKTLTHDYRNPIFVSSYLSRACVANFTTLSSKLLSLVLCF